MKLKRISAAAVSVLMCISVSGTAFAEQEAVQITVSPSEELKSISPYIYGVNSGADLTAVSAESFRLGGNRLSAYNWETNVSNAGSDWNNTSDMYLIQNALEEYRFAPGGAALQASYDAQNANIPYTLLTLQMVGYTSSDKRGRPTKEDAAPSSYWDEVVNRKNGEFLLEPDTDDDYVYMDEYLNYLITTLGNSESATGFKGYALDNEPSLWRHTHSLIQQESLTCAELIEKSVDLAKVIKDMDSGADVFGPSLFGYSAFDTFAGAPDWNQLEKDNGYRWFIDYYLDEMRKAEEENGRRLLDVLDIHFYTEAKGACGERSCNHYDNDECIKARLDSVRALYDETYRENSWINDTGAEFFPLLPNIKQSVDTYYPDTKLAFTEYNFGGGDHISGAVAQADTLGIFAENDVYFATIWSFDQNEYQLAAINMFTNYDGMGNGFGDTLVKSEYDNENISVYSSVDSEDKSTVKIIVTNRNINSETPVNIKLSSENIYTDAEVYSLYGDTAEIQQMNSLESISENSISYTLPALSVTEFVVHIKENTVNIPLIAGIAVSAIILIIIAVVLFKKLAHK